MLNLIKAELYKFIHRPYMYVLTGLMALGVALVFILISNTLMVSKMYAITNFIPIGLEGAMLILLLFGVVLSEEYKIGTMKNLVTSNLSRTKIYIGKFITQSIIGVLSFGIVVSIFIIGMSFLEGGEGYSAELYKEFIIRLLSMIPIFIGALAILNFWMVLTQKESVAPIVYYFSLIISESFIGFLGRRSWSGFMTLKDWLIMPQIDTVVDFIATRGVVVHIVLVGIITTIVFTIISTIIFKKREIK